MNTILGELGKSLKFCEYIKKIENQKSPIVISGLTDVGMAQMISATKEFVKRPICVITYNEIQARKIVDDIEIGETIRGNELPLKDFGRVAAGTAKQIVVQKIKEAEKQSISEEFKDKEGELMVGTLAREDKQNYYVDLGRAHGILPKSEIIPGEELVMGSQVKVYVSKIELGQKGGPVILLSRSHYGFVKRLLEKEIPELNEGIVILYSVARDPGSRSKIAVYSENEKVDAVGACIGEKGSRIARIIEELHGEKIDVVRYDKDPAIFIENALSPAKNLTVAITDPKKQEAMVIAGGDNFSLAIGRKGQNVKLASRLTHYKIEVKSESAMLEDEVVYTTKDDSEEESA